MPNLKSLKNRIKSVKSTGKITQAMKMVSAAKIKKAENAAKESRPFSNYLLKICSELVKKGVNEQFDDGKFNSALENYPALIKKRTVKNVGLLVLTSDKGLAGAYNTNIIKKTIAKVDELRKQGLGVKLFIVGLKGIVTLKKTFANTNVEVVKNYSKIPPLVEVEVAKMIAEDLAQNYITRNIDCINVIYTEFKTMLSNQLTEFQLLPLTIPNDEAKQINPEMVFEPSKEEVLQKLVPLYIANTVYTALKEAMASELAARMNAMSNATKNATEMVTMLENQYNKVRQYSITEELIEVVSGAGSV